MSVISSLIYTFILKRNILERFRLGGDLLAFVHFQADELSASQFLGLRESTGCVLHESYDIRV